MIRVRRRYNKLPLPPVDWRFYLSLLAAIFFAASLFYFLTGIRNLIMSGLYGLMDLNTEVLAPLKLFLYDVYIALICSFAGFAVFSNMWVNSKWWIPIQVKASSTLDQVYLSGYFIFLALKIGLSIIVLEADIDWALELWPLLPLSVVVLFFQQLSEFRRRFHNITNRLVAKMAAAQLTFALIVAATPVFDSEGLAAWSTNHSPTAALDLNVPTSELSLPHYRMSLGVYMHIANKKATNDLFVGFGPFSNKPVSRNALPSLLRKEREKLIEWEQDQLTVLLYADRDLSASTILSNVHELRYEGAVRLFLITNTAEGHGGIPFFLPQYCTEALTKMGLTPPGNPPPIPIASWCTYLQDDDPRAKDLVALSLRDNRIYLNDTLMTKQQLFDWAYARVADMHRHQQKQYEIYLTTDATSNYQAFVDVFDATRKALFDYRSFEIRKQFGVEYTSDTYSFDDAFSPEVRSFLTKTRAISIIVPAPVEDSLFRERHRFR